MTFELPIRTKPGTFSDKRSECSTLLSEKTSKWDAGTASTAPTNLESEAAFSNEDNHDGGISSNLVDALDRNLDHEHSATQLVVDQRVDKIVSATRC